MYVRVWEYEVAASHVDAFLAVYGASGPWAELFARSDGFAGTQLFRDVDQASHFLTVDRWADAASWAAFLESSERDYRELDQRLHGMAAGGEAVIDGSAPGA